jgi:hypothetical protein
MRKLPAVAPIKRYMKVMLTNGAVITMPTVAEKTTPFLAAADIYSASLWELKTMVQQTDLAKDLEKQRVKEQKLADFYKKYGYGEEDEGEEADEEAQK